MGPMTFLEAALEILRRERRPLHYKDIAQKAMDRKLLTFVGRTPEVTMQTQLTAAVKKTPGNPFVRVKPGTFGLLRYPEGAPEPEAAPAEKRASGSSRAAAASGAAAGAGAAATSEARSRRRRRGGRGRNRRDGAPEGEATEARGSEQALQRKSAAREESMADDDEDNGGTDEAEPEIGSLSPEARAAALAESGVLESEAQDDDDDEDEVEAEGPGEGDEGEEAEDEEDEDGDEDDEDEDDEEEDEDDEEETAHRPADSGASPSEGAPSSTQSSTERPGSGEGSAGGGRTGSDLEGDDDDLEEVGEPGMAAGGAGAGGAFEEVGGGRRRRRRRRRRGGGEGAGFEGNGPAAGGGLAGGSSSSGEGARVASESSSSGDLAAGGPSESNGDSQGVRRIMSPVDAAIEILRGQSPGRGMHVRQLADAASRRRLIHGEPNEAWRVMRAALAAEPKERLRAGLRPRIRGAGSGLFALSRRTPDLDLEKAEHVFGEARRALRERTLAALEQRLTELTPSAFEAIARVLLQREGFGPATFVKRVEGTVYLEVLRGRGARPSRCLVALRAGSASAGRRAIGELRAGIRARNQDEGVLLLAARLAEDGIAEWKQPGPPIEVADGAALAETCVRHGVGIINTMVSVDFVDADFFAELQEG